jgi:glycosyltransferase involved in cell wall biosynthesis
MIKHNVNILHPHGYKADLYAFAASWPGRAALVATCHNWPSNLLKMRMYAALDRLVLRRFDQVIAVSDFASDILHRWGVHPDRVSTIYNGVELERFDRAVPTLRNEISPKGYSLVGFVGRLVSDKGGAFLLQAAQQVIAARPNTMFVLVGEGPARTEWEALATKLGIGKQVAFAGVRKDMPGVYASLDMVVLPSLMESMPMCLLEAMASGKPVVATRVGAVSKLVSSEENGLLLESGDKSGLVDAMLRLLGDPVFASRLGQNGRERVVQHFSAAAMARCYIRQYERVLRSRRNRTKQAQPEVSPG